MTPPADWTTPIDIRNELQRHWDRGRILAARLDGTPLFPLALRFRRPDAKALSERFDDVRKWIKALEEGSKVTQGFGYEIEWTEINHRQIGRNRLPVGVKLAAEHDAVRLIGKHRQVERFRCLTDATLRRFPALLEWLTRHPLTVLDHAEDWTRIIGMLAWFRDHPRAGLYLRQLDIEGVDTKFIEARKGLLSELLDRVLPTEAVDERFTGASRFEQRYGLASKPPLVRFRLLDKGLGFGELTDLTVPATEFARISIAARRTFITENEINGLAFPLQTHSLVIFGLGHALGLLGEAEWLKSTSIYYWGDIDTHGFAILDRLRATFPHVKSFLMDRATLIAHRRLWVWESDRYEGALSRLVDAEQALFEDLKSNALGQGVRLEQERISFGWLKRELATLPAA